MTTLTLPSATVTLHDSPRTLPEFRRVEHDCYALIESGVGSTMEDVDRHFETLTGLIGPDNEAALLTGINNARFLFYNLLGKQYSARSLAFCCLVETVDGVRWPDYSPEGVEELARLLAAHGLTDQQIVNVLGDSKKNFIRV